MSGGLFALLLISEKQGRLTIAAVVSGVNSIKRRIVIKNYTLIVLSYALMAIVFRNIVLRVLPKEDRGIESVQTAVACE